MLNQTLNIKRTFIGALLPFCLSMTACSSQQAVGFSVIKESIQCRIQQPTIKAISNQQDKDELIKQLSSYKNKENPSNPFAQLIMKHSETEQLFLVSQGQKNSSGYGFLVSGNEGLLIDSTLTLPISFTSPDKNSMQAQMMTSPCLVLGIDSKTQYDHLVIDSLELTISK
tara:strand:+ start:5061 stop:5570 length:510 start_codon:yes stop_codon:yes gene_type:complete